MGRNWQQYQTCKGNKGFAGSICALSYRTPSPQVGNRSEICLLALDSVKSLFGGSVNLPCCTFHCLTSSPSIVVTYWIGQVHPTCSVRAPTFLTIGTNHHISCPEQTQTNYLGHNFLFSSAKQDALRYTFC